MVYFLGSDAEVAITTEASGTCVKVSKDSNGEFTLAAEAAATPTGGYGINDLRATNAEFPTDALVDITGIDLGIGALDEDIDYLGHRTPLKAEVHKQTTVTLTFKRKNVVFDVIYDGDSSATQRNGRWGVNSSTTKMRYGLEEPDTDFGYRLYIKLLASHNDTNTIEFLMIRNAQMTNNTVTLNADGTQEQSIEFTSSVSPVAQGTVNVTPTSAEDL